MVKMATGESQKASKSKKDKNGSDDETEDCCTWTAAEEATLVEALGAQTALGLQAESGFKGTAWTAIVAALAEEHPSQNPKTLKGEYRIVKELRDLSGSGWNDTRQMVVAEKDVWDKYLQSHPKAKPFKKKPFPLYDLIAPLVDKVIVTGHGAMHLAAKDTEESTSRKASSPEADEDEEPVKSKGGSSSQAVEYKDGDDEKSEDEALQTPAVKKRKAPTDISTIKRARKSGADGLFAVAGALEHLVGMSSTNDQAFGPTTPQRRTQAIQRAEEEEEGFSNHEYAEIARLLSKDDNATTYLAFRRKGARKAWLEGELQRQFDGDKGK
ncbi:hypothetical protein M422DRAFT_245894 [Sphaerobolus stellatus SS14]|nr:hypothetical protein M422DRAFT_245894 [Sphaerobolus stellatus SS14]